MGRDKKKIGKEGRREGGGGKIVTLSTSTSTQIPNHKTNTVNKLLHRARRHACMRES